MSEQSETQFKGYAGPNYTPVPDELFDEQLPDLSGAELKVLLYIMRRTFGFKRESDNISISQMLNGLRGRNGQQMDRGVGLSKKTLLLAIRTLEERNIVLTERRRSVEKGDEPTTYRLNVLGGETQREGTSGHDEHDEHGESVDKPTELVDKLVDKLVDNPVQLVDKSAREETTPPVGEFLPHGGRGPFSPLLEEKSTPPVGEFLPHPRGGIFTPPPWGNFYPTQDTEKREREERDRLIESSNIREKIAVVDNFVDKSVDNFSPPFPPPDATELGISVPPTEASREREQLRIFVQDFAREFNDAAPLRSSTSRMANLYRQAHLPMEEFIAHLYAARLTTQERTGAIRTAAGEPDANWKKNKMSYFFAVLARQLGLSELPGDDSGGGESEITVAPPAGAKKRPPPRQPPLRSP